MAAEQSSKIDAAVARCLDECRGEQPYARLSEFIAGLKADANWSSDEIIEFQTQVIRALLFRHGRHEAPVVAAASTSLPSRAVWLGLTLVSVVILVLTLVILVLYLAASLTLNSQFSGLRQQRQDAMKYLKQPAYPRPAQPPAEPPEKADEDANK
jgi:hypothetical protein